MDVLSGGCVGVVGFVVGMSFIIEVKLIGGGVFVVLLLVGIVFGVCYIEVVGVVQCKVDVVVVMLYVECQVQFDYEQIVVV